MNIEIKTALKLLNLIKFQNNCCHDIAFSYMDTKMPHMITAWNCFNITDIHTNCQDTECNCYSKNCLFLK